MSLSTHDQLWLISIGCIKVGSNYKLLYYLLIEKMAQSLCYVLLWYRKGLCVKCLKNLGLKAKILRRMIYMKPLHTETISTSLKSEESSE